MQILPFPGNINASAHKGAEALMNIMKYGQASSF